MLHQLCSYSEFTVRISKTESIGKQSNEYEQTFLFKEPFSNFFGATRKDLINKSYKHLEHFPVNF